MFYKIQDWKNFLLSYLGQRKKELKGESKEFRNIDEAYQAGFLRGFWEGAGESFQHSQKC